MDEATAEQVRQRAGFTCEYCLLPAAQTQGPFEIEHVVAVQHGGTDAMSNHDFACMHCNRHKGPNIAGIDRQTSRTRVVRLFDPRRHVWSYHFVWDGPFLRGRTPIGRVTVEVLNINAPIRVALRAQLIAEGVFPPPEPTA